MLREPGAGVHSHQQVQKKAEISAESPEAAEGMEQGDPSAYDEEKELQLWLSLDSDVNEEEAEESAHQTEKLNLNEW